MTLNGNSTKEINLLICSEQSGTENASDAVITDQERSISMFNSMLDSENEDKEDCVSTTTTTTSRSKSPGARFTKINRRVKSPKVVKPIYKYK